MNPKLETVGDIALGVYEQIAWQAHDSFIGSTACSGREFRRSAIRDINPDYGKIAIGKFPNVRAALASGSLRAVFVRIGTNALLKSHTLLLTMVRCFVNVVWFYFFRVASDKSQQVICSRVAQILRQEREKRGLSMNLVAERAGLSQQMVSYVEREMRNPTLETLLRIAAAMKIDLATVLHKAQRAASKPK
jgi:DNA-binding XRE family transcriptional regulator